VICGDARAGGVATGRLTAFAASDGSAVRLVRIRVACNCGSGLDVADEMGLLREVWW
jgi:hypothetical protein